MAMSAKDLDLEAEDFKIIIAGSTGRMGAMLMQKGREAGFNVIGLDRPFEEADIKKACEKADLVVLCVPARNLAAVAKKFVSQMEKKTILADITSVKELPMRKMRELWDGQIVGTHPLFGPKAPEGADLPVAITKDERTNQKSVDIVSNFFKKIGCHVFETTPSQHDQAMARIQNMNFITELAYFAVLATHEELLPFLTPSFERRKQSAAKLLNEDAEMFAGLFEANPHSHEAVRQYRQMLNLAASGDIELLCKRAQWWWDSPKIKQCEKNGEQKPEHKTEKNKK